MSPRSQALARRRVAMAAIDRCDDFRSAWSLAAVCLRDDGQCGRGQCCKECAEWKGPQSLSVGYRDGSRAGRVELRLETARGIVFFITAPRQFGPAKENGAL